MRRSLLAIPVTGVLLSAQALGLAGCGDSSPSAAPASKIRSAPAETGSTAGAAPAASLTLSSPVFSAGRLIASGRRAIPAHFTCDGADVSPPLHWSAVPTGTADELVLLVFDLRSPGSTRNFAWSVAGIKPYLTSISAGRVPEGAVVGKNESGQNRYSVCPAKGTSHPYLVTLFAVRQPLSLKTGFDPNSVYEKIGGAGLSQGQSGFSYKRT
jgi:phosphatidylethanolamine-binding protein (PEBP) family uncharacterized protein